MRNFIILLVLLIVFICGAGAYAYINYVAPSRLDSPLSDADEFKNPPPVLPVAPVVHVATASAVHIPILMYHYIEHVKDPGDTIRQKLDIFPETLDSEIKTLVDAGYTFLYASEVGSIIDGTLPLPPKPVVLTFDDGYRDFYTDAFPILEKYHVKSTAYIITSSIGKLNYMYKSQLDAVEQSGIVELAAHTMHHIDLQHATDAKATAEIVGSKLALEEWYQKPVVSFAYPGGRFNIHTLDIVAKAGFTNAVSTMPGTQVSSGNRFILFRLRPGSRTGKRLLDFLNAAVEKVDVMAPQSQPE